MFSIEWFIPRIEVKPLQLTLKVVADVHHFRMSVEHQILSFVRSYTFPSQRRTFNKQNNDLSNYKNAFIINILVYKLTYTHIKAYRISIASYA